MRSCKKPVDSDEDSMINLASAFKNKTFNAREVKFQLVVCISIESLR